MVNICEALACPKRGRGRPRADESAFDRNQVLRQAFHFFAGHGYDNSSMRELAAACGISNTLLHKHFGTKDALWFEAVDTQFGPVFRELMAVLDGRPGESGEQTRRRLMLHSLNLTANEKLTLSILFRDAEGDSERAEHIRRTYVEPFLRRYNDFAATDTGGAVDPVRLAAMHALVTGVMRVLLVPDMLRNELAPHLDSDDNRRRLTETIVDLLFNGLTPRPAPVSGNSHHE